MSGAPRVRSMNIDEAEVEAEARPVLVPAGNKARVGPTARKPASKPARKPPERLEFGGAEAKKKAPKNPNESVSPVISPLSAPPVSRKHELLLRPNLSMNASCSSDASTDSSCSRACSRASTGRIGKGGLMIRPRSSVVKRDKAVLLKEEKVVPDGVPVQSPELVEGKRKCAWVTPNTGENFLGWFMHFMFCLFLLCVLISCFTFLVVLVQENLLEKLVFWQYCCFLVVSLWPHFCL